MRRLGGALVLLVVFAAACSGEGDGPGLGPSPKATASPDPAPPESSPELTGSDAILIDRFTPTDYMAADGSFRSVLADTEPWFEFSADGTVAGHDGCNGFTGTFIISGAYTDPASTTRAADDGQILAMGNFAVDSTNQCADDVAAQATDLVAALDGANRWVWLDPSFILRDSRATNTLVAVATP